LGDFKGAYGRLMNEYLLTKNRDASLAKTVMDLKQALAHAATPTDMLGHRGVGAAEAAFYRQLGPGAVTRAACFVSASLRIKVAAAVAARQPGGTTIQIVVHAGQKAVAYVDPFPTYLYPQSEILVNAGTTLKVLRADNEVIRLEVGYDDAIG
jgi:hypothetical protein